MDPHEHSRRGLPPAVLAALVVAFALSGCRSALVDRGCLGCHAGLELASSTHDGCVPCHGGDPAGTTPEAAHRGLFGLSNPSYEGRWELGCGPCHRLEVERMKSNQMFTNAGMIAQIQATWEGEHAGGPFAARQGSQSSLQGASVQQHPVAELDNLSGELYRKFCARCHLGKMNDAAGGNAHAAGCAACHFPFGDTGEYRGVDRTMRGRVSHSTTHALQGLPPMSACTACHQRSGRIALSYQGLCDGNNALVPTRGGNPGPMSTSDDRSFTHIAPDVHFSAGMECIDCHTSREVMGEGYAAPDMRGQLEIRCENCHGDGVTRPQSAPVFRENELPLRESRQYGRRIAPGTRMVLTSKGRPYSNVLVQGDSVMVMLKRSGRMLRSPVVTGTPEHRIAGHERVECYTCHSRSVVQCYGCHTTYDKRELGWDFVRDAASPGVFSEKEDVRKLSPFPLAVDDRGRISPVTPGCQTFITVIEKDSTRSRDEYVAHYRGKQQLRFAPFFGHNTGTRAVGCAECHGDPAYLGFGQSVLEGGSSRGSLLCEKNPKKPLDGFLAMEDGRVVAHAAISREGGRPLNGGEVRRVFAVNLCLVCHDSARDPIYRSKVNYRALDDSLHRRLLSAGR